MSDIDLLNVARTGIDAEAFARSDIGKFLMSKAQAEIKEATIELVDADPFDGKANQEIRNRIHIANMFLVWLDEAIHAGRLAHDQLREMDDLS